MAKLSNTVTLHHYKLKATMPVPWH